ncbi:MAG: RNA polymerase sigma-70 factor (ECF subfamily) [Enterobacterales bacterium]
MVSNTQSTLNFNEASGKDMLDIKSTISQRVRIERFLSSVQNSGYRMAQLATSNTDDAMELVQETMLQLVKRYSDRPDNELKILFYRILSSRITDWYRKTAFRRQFQMFFPKESYESGDPVQLLSDDYQLAISDEVDNGKQIERLFKALKELSKRQHQVFLLRAWQGFNVKETAAIMECSTGSVKTHYSRAIKSLRTQLDEQLVDKLSNDSNNAPNRENG